MSEVRRNSKHGAPNQAPNKHKLKQLALYVAKKSEADPKFGKVKLNKILFYADFLHYLKTGHSITGYAYIKMQFGPCPDGFHKLQKAMDKAGELKVQESAYHGHPQQRLIALVLPKLAEFTGDEIATVQEVIEGMQGLNGRQVSDWSHTFIGWQLAEEFEKIPYSVARITIKKELSPARIKSMEETARRIKEAKEAGNYPAYAG
jgi:hypothetical protein